MKPHYVVIAGSEQHLVREQFGILRDARRAANRHLRRIWALKKKGRVNATVTHMPSRQVVYAAHINTTTAKRRSAKRLIEIDQYGYLPTLGVPGVRAE